VDAWTLPTTATFLPGFANAIVSQCSSIGCRLQLRAMSMQPTTRDVSRGLAWLGVVGTLAGVLDLIALLVILNNWISAEDYGIATKCIWIVPLLDQATDLGLSAALIQRDDHTSDRVSTVFWLNLALSTSLFLLLVLLAPPLATHFYGHAIIGWMLIAYGGKLLMQNGYFIPIAMMRRELRFKEISVVKIFANLAEFVAKIGFAWAGFGIWCFVAGPLARTFVYLIGLQLRHPYRPTRRFNVRDAREYVTFGLRTSGSQLLFYFYTNVDYPIVGYFFGNTGLGLYRLAYEVVLEPTRMISNFVVDAAFPAFARLRHSTDAVMQQFISFTRLNVITVASFIAIVFVAAPELLHVLFPGYEAATSAIRILCAVAVMRAVGFVAPPLLDGVGYPQRTLRYMIVAATAMPASYILGAVVLGDTLGFESVAVAWAVGYPIAFMVLIYMTTQTIGFSVWTYVRQVAGVAGCMLFAGVVGAGVRWMMGDFPAALTLAATAAAVLLAAGFLLAYTQGLSIRSMMRSMKDPPKTEGASSSSSTSATSTMKEP
jgi:O-antigen/teichoic acid export membrane protein